MPFAINNGIRIHYEVEGEGPPLVLGHGSGVDGASWRDYGYVEPLKKDFTLIMVDARGHGESDKPLDPAAYELPNHVADFVAVLDSLRISRAHFFGYSMGGRLGLGCAALASDRFESLVIGASHPYFRDASPMRQAFSKGATAWVGDLQKLFGDRLTPALRERLLKNNSEALVAAHQDRPDIHEQVLKATNHMLFVVGDQDPICPDVVRFARSSGRWEARILPGLDHVGGLLGTDLMVPIVKEFLGRK